MQTNPVHSLNSHSCWGGDIRITCSRKFWCKKFDLFRVCVQADRARLRRWPQLHPVGRRQSLARAVSDDRNLTFYKKTIATILRCPAVWPDWRYFKVLGDKFSYKSSPNLCWLFGLLWKHLFYTQTAYLMFRQLLEIFGLLYISASGHTGARIEMELRFFGAIKIV